MGNFKWSEKELRFLTKAVSEGKPWEDMTEELGRSVTAIRIQAGKLGLKQVHHSPVNKGFSIDKPPVSVNRSIDELFADQVERFKAKQSRSETKRSGIDVSIEGEGPYALMLFGDPHADDDGCDLEYLAYCMEVTKTTPRTFAINIGDMLNNWIGRLGRLYAHQHTTDDEGIKFMEWLLVQIPWLAVTLGNHDLWNSAAQMACRHAGVLYVSHGARFNIRCGDSVLKVDARHDHPGRSQYNAAFGQVKQQYRGSDCHIIAGGHIHTGAYTLVKNGVSGRLGHCIRLGAFKRYDEYADAMGFSDDSIGPCCMVVVDTNRDEDEPGFCSVFWNLEHGAAFLAMLRSSHIASVV